MPQPKKLGVMPRNGRSWMVFAIRDAYYTANGMASFVGWAETLEDAVGVCDALDWFPAHVYNVETDEIALLDQYPDGASSYGDATEHFQEWLKWLDDQMRKTGGG